MIGVAVDYVREAADKLAEFHPCGEIHGDVRPDNLTPDESGQVTNLAPVVFGRNSSRG